MRGSQPPAPKPKKWLGQNFLRDERILRRILDAAGLKKTDVVLEIGPGTGILTKALAARVKKVIAVEKDPHMVEILKEELKNFNNVEIVLGDILDTKYQILNTKYKVVANLPYYITSPVIRKFLETGRKPTLMVLMVQKEVAQRICAKPPNMSLLAVSVQFYGKPEIISYVSKNSFWPVPKVDSAILRLKPTIVGFQQDMQTNFFRVVRAGFRQPRKQLGNNLPKELLISKDIDQKRRAETLTMQEWIALAKDDTMKE